MPLLVLLILGLFGLVFVPVSTQAANTLLTEGRSSSSSRSGLSGGQQRRPHVPPSAETSPLFSSAQCSFAAPTAQTPTEGEDGGGDGEGGRWQHLPAGGSCGRSRDDSDTDTGDSDESAGISNGSSTSSASGGSGSNSGGGGGGSDGSGDDGGEAHSGPSDGYSAGAAAHAAAAATAIGTGAGDADARAASKGPPGWSRQPLRPLALTERARVKAAKTWRILEIGVARAIHVRREVKAMFSSELERCLLKATRPENIAVDEACMVALLAQANRLSAVEACCDCDPYEVVCSKVLKKMMERDWRTVAKALYVMHRLERDSPAKEATRFSAFFREQWAEGAGALGKHMRRDGGALAPWLKVYCGYLAARGMHLETATNAFRSWETLTSTRQLHKALAETNALLAGALALHFAGDASAVGGGGEAVRRACCALAFKDVADARELLFETGQPPALLDVLGVGDGLPLPEADPLSSSPPPLPPPEPASPSRSSLPPRHPPSLSSSPQSTSLESASPEPEEGEDGGDEDRRDQPPPFGAGSQRDTTVAADGGAGHDDGDGYGHGHVVGLQADTGEAEDRAPPPPSRETLREEEEERAAAAAAAVAALQDMPEDVLKAAKECAIYEDVNGVITAVYSARYVSDAAGNTPVVPLWVRQMAALARLSDRIGDAGGIGGGSDNTSDSSSTSSISPSSISTSDSRSGDSSAEGGSSENRSNAGKEDREQRPAAPRAGGEAESAGAGGGRVASTEAGVEAGAEEIGAVDLGSDGRPGGEDPRGEGTRRRPTILDTFATMETGTSLDDTASAGDGLKSRGGGCGGEGGGLFFPWIRGSALGATANPRRGWVASGRAFGDPRPS